MSVIVWSLMIRALGGEPFRMTVEPDDGQAIVQFVQPDAGLISESFQVKIRCEKHEEIVLSSASAKIPGGEIEFADTTLLPGRFMIRIGGSRFDVMQRRIDVDGKPSDWRPGNR